MTDTAIRYGAGWGTAQQMMSDNMRARVAAADRAYERQAELERRERAERAAYTDEMRIRASIEQAIERGEFVNFREAYNNGGVGRTRAELLAYVSAQQDREDAVARSRARREMQRLGLDAAAYSESMSGDTSVPTEAERAEAEATRAAEVAGQIERGRAIQRVREHQAAGRRMWQAARQVLRARDMGAL